MSVWETIDGFFTFPDYYRWVATRFALKMVEARDLGRFETYHLVEVGVYTGQSAAFLLEELGNGKGALAAACKLDPVDLEMTKHRARENLARLDGSANFIELDSVEASKQYQTASLDFVFIDADHRYESVRRDIDAWLPKVKPGGIIAGHDFCNWPEQNFGVIQAVTETFDRFEVWRGRNGMGNEPMKPHYWPVWSVQL